MRRSEWLEIWRKMADVPLRDRIQSAGRNTKADSFDVFIGLHEAVASGVEELVVCSVDLIDRGFR